MQEEVTMHITTGYRQYNIIEDAHARAGYALSKRLDNKPIYGISTLYSSLTARSMILRNIIRAYLNEFAQQYEIVEKRVV